MTLNEQKKQIRSKIAELTSKAHLSVTERSQLTALIAQGKEITATEERQGRAQAAYASAKKDLPEADTEEVRAAKFAGAFRRYLRSGDNQELRTYAALTTSGVAIPESFSALYVEALKSFSGIRKVSNVISTTNGDSLKSPFTNDTANTGERLNENDPVSLANPTFNKTVFGAYRYSSKGCQYSAQLLQDSGIPVEGYLANIFARRIGRLTNSEFTNGASGAMTGVIPSITNIVTSGAVNTVTVGDVVACQAIDEAFLDGAVYMFSPAVERTLKAMLGTDGLPTFPEMRTARVICGYPYVFNVDMPTTLSAGVKAIAFGNFGHAVTIREVTPSLLVSRETYAEFNLLFASLRADQDCQVCDASALSVLAQHA